ncbi:polysaccharide deacetylase family protein [bacterium]|nr:polysaccharide deacetylase family protein [bacterium]
MKQRRDLRGYWPTWPTHTWPGGATLAVSIVVNVEEGAELSIADGDERNESVYEIREEVEGAADLCMETHFAYGSRMGYQRIADELDHAGVLATFSSCGRAAERSPWLLQDAVRRGHEVACHGWRWERHAGFDEAREKKTIQQTVQAISAATGVAPVGWHTRSSPTLNTRRLLVEHGGFAYDSDAYDDDCPYIIDSGVSSHVVLPYAFDTNDMRFSPGGGFVHADDFSRYVIAAFDRLRRESQSATRMLSIGLHLRLIGRPARIAGLESVLAHITGHSDVWCAPRRDIAAHWRVVCGLPVWSARGVIE